MEPGLALMDEIGRRALTNAFINFTRSHATSGVNPTAAYRDSLIYDDCRLSTLDMEEEEEEQKRRRKVNYLTRDEILHRIVFSEFRRLIPSNYDTLWEHECHVTNGYLKKTKKTEAKLSYTEIVVLLFTNSSLCF